MRKQTRKIESANLKAIKNGHLKKTITPSKHILKKRKENLYNRKISVTINNTTTYLKVKELSNHTDIIITKANKGGAIVVMGVKYYINEANRQLNNEDHYKILYKNPTTTNVKLVNDIIQRFKKQKLLKEKIADRLKVSNPKTPKFYM